MSTEALQRYTRSVLPRRGQDVRKTLLGCGALVLIARALDVRSLLGFITVVVCPSLPRITCACAAIDVEKADGERVMHCEDPQA